MSAVSTKKSFEHTTKNEVFPIFLEIFTNNQKNILSKKFTNSYNFLGKKEFLGYLHKRLRYRPFRPKFTCPAQTEGLTGKIFFFKNLRFHIKIHHERFRGLSYIFRTLEPS